MNIRKDASHIISSTLSSTRSPTRSLLCLALLSKKTLRTRGLRLSFICKCAPRGAGAPSYPLVPSLPVFCSFLLFPFLVGFDYFLLLSIPLLSTRIVPLRFQAGGRRKRPNLGLVCCVYFVLSVFLNKMDFGVLLYLV